MKDLMWLLSVYPYLSDRIVIVLEYLFCHQAYKSRLGLEKRFFSLMNSRWRQV